MDLSNSPAVVLTRKHEDNEWLRIKLEAMNIRVVELPCVATRFVRPGAIPGAVDAVVFTSRNGVKGFLNLPESGEILKRAPKPLVCAVGRATASLLSGYGAAPDVVADPPDGTVLASLIRSRLKIGSTILMVRGNLRASAIDEIVQSAGYMIVPCEVYENYDPEVEAVKPFAVSSIFVGSPSAGLRLLEANPWMREAVFIAIGETTKSALEKLLVRQVITAGAEPDSWVETIKKSFSEGMKKSEEGL